MRKYFLPAFLISLFLASCNFDSIELDKVEGPTINTSIALNLGSVEYTVGDLVDDLEDESLEVVTGEDFFLSFVQRDTSLYDDISEFITLEDEIGNSDTYSPFAVDIPAQPTENVVVIPTRVFDFEFNPEGGEGLDSTFFKGGTLRYNLTSNFGSQIDFALTLTDIQEATTNIPVVFDGTLAATETNQTGTTSLAGKKNVAERVGSANIFNVELDLTFTIPAGVAIDASDEITLELIFENAEFSAVFGDFGMDPVDVQEETIEISAFDDFSDGGLFLADPSVQLDFINKFGVEFGVSLGNVRAMDEDGSEISLAGDVVDNLQFIDAPNDTQLGEAVSSSFSINVDNSNIDDLLNSTPESLTFSIAATPNAPGSDNLNNFLFDSSFMEIRTTIEIPLDLRMDGFSRDFDFGIDGTELSDAESITINLLVENDIPFDGSVDLSFRDDSGTELYVLSDLNIITSPNTFDSDGRSTQPAQSSEPIELSGDGIEAFLNTTEVVATINIFTFNTASGSSVKIFSDYQLTINLTAQGQISVDL